MGYSLFEILTFVPAVEIATQNIMCITHVHTHVLLQGGRMSNADAQVMAEEASGSHEKRRPHAAAGKHAQRAQQLLP